MHAKEAQTATPEQVLREVLDVLSAIRDGHFTAHMNDYFPGVGGEIAKVVNEHLELLQALRREHLRIMEEVGVVGRLGGQAELPPCTGAWKEMEQAMNTMSANVTNQVRNCGSTVRAILRGDPAARVTAQSIRGEFRELAEDLNELAQKTAERAAAGV